MEHNAKNICKTFINSKEQNLNKKCPTLKFPCFFNILCIFWPNSIFFQGLEKRFHNSILFQ